MTRVEVDKRCFSSVIRLSVRLSVRLFLAPWLGALVRKVQDVVVVSVVGV